MWPHLPALAWALPLRYRLPLRLPNSPTIPVNVDQTYQPPALMTKKNKTKFQVPSPSLVNPAPTLAVLTTKTTTKIRRMKVYFFFPYIYLILSIHSVEHHASDDDNNEEHPGTSLTGEGNESDQDAHVDDEEHPSASKTGEEDDMPKTGPNTCTFPFSLISILHITLY